MDLEEEFKEIVQRQLDGLIDRFDEELKQIMERVDASQCAFIHFEYDSMLFDEEFAVKMHFLKDGTTPLHNFTFLDGEIIVPEEVFWDEKYEEIAPGGRASEVLDCWLADRWLHYRDYVLPAYASHHDTLNVMNLVTGRTANWDQVTKENG